MIDIDKLLNNEVSREKEVVNRGGGIICDLEYWMEKFISFMEASKLSKQTQRSYSLTLSALKEFCLNKYGSNEENINLSDFNAVVANEFLVYMENYNVNKEFGDLKYRIGILFKYSDNILHCNSIEELLNVPKELCDKFSISEMETFDYMIKQFANFLSQRKIQPAEVNNSIIAEYIKSIPVLSNKTMQQRKAGLQSFLSYIDRSTKEELFKTIYWELKKYPLPKQNSKVIKGAFDEELVKNILFVLNDYAKNTEKYVSYKKHTKSSCFAGYKNAFLILVMMYGGARASEATNIKFSDVEEITLDNGDQMYKIKVLGKGNKERFLYLKKIYIKEYYEYLVLHKGKNNYISGKQSSEKPLTRQALFNFAKKIFKLAGSEKKGLHIFRHHFASNFVEKNGNIKLLQEILDHSNVSTTMIYSNVREKIKLGALNEL